jgi:hypothetical protein
MYLPFESLPDTARVWIYQANRSLDFGEVESASAELMNFCNGWKSHGAEVKSSFQVFHNRFLVLAADETAMGGCSIDGSVAVIRKLEHQFDVVLLDRMLVGVVLDGLIWTLPLQEFKERCAKGEIQAQTLMYNHSIATKAELSTHWLIPVGESWAAKYLALKTGNPA